MENRTFGEYLKQERKKKKMTQKEFCKIIGVSVNTLVNYENGHIEPSITKQNAILKKLERDCVIGKNIWELRKGLGMTQSELAEKINARKETIYKYEKGIVVKIPYENLLLMADALGVTFEELTKNAEIDNKIRKLRKEKNWVQERRNKTMISFLANKRLSEAVDEELDACLEEYGGFRNHHEAWAVLLEEIQEVTESNDSFNSDTEGAMDRLWDYIRQNVEFENNEVLEIENIFNEAEEIAKECIQVMAVCKKWMRLIKEEET